MRVLFLCEGDAETAHGSFSGSAKSLVDHLRAAGHEVICGDVDLKHFTKMLGAAATVATGRARWSARYHLEAAPFALRSLHAAARVRATPRVDCVLQIGATFRVPDQGSRPVFLYCDSNIRMAERGAATGQSQAAQLRPAEIARVAAREAEVYRAATAVFTISDRLRRSLIEDFGLAPKKVHAVHAGPNFDPREAPAKLPLRVPDAPPTILFVGKRFLRKGGDLLLAAFQRVRAVLPDARLVIVGPDALPDTPPGVELLGFLRKDVPAEWQRLQSAYASADVFCLPTRYEPFGIVFLEAMFYGLPCVGTDAWAVPEMIEDGRTGYLFPPDDGDALADRLLRLLRDPEAARAMGEAGRARAAGYFTWEAVARRMILVMESRQAPRSAGSVS